jgi:RNA polymerase sigma-70 factor (ECF subfamily)
VPPREGPRPGPPADPDQALVARARRGDADAFGDLVRAHQHRLVNFVRALVSDAADAEDVAQEAFMRAYRGLRGFRGGSSFKTWLYQIATNTARTHLARRRDRPEQAQGDPAATPEAFGQPDTGEDVLAAVVLRDRVDRALAALPEDLRIAVVLRDVMGFDYTEIAQATGSPLGTVESRIFRGRARLRGLVAEPSGAGGARGGSS